MTATPTPSRVHLTLALIKAALGIGGLLLVVVLIVMAVVGGHDKAGATKADGGAYLACSHAAGVFDDWQHGLLTPGELRDKTKEIYSDASVSTEPGIASNAQAMLAAATSDDDASYIMAASAFVDACNKLIP